MYVTSRITSIWIKIEEWGKKSQWKSVRMYQIWLLSLGAFSGSVRQKYTYFNEKQLQPCEGPDV